MEGVFGEVSGLLQRLLFCSQLVVLAQLVRVVQRPGVEYALAA
jgi:hypothetical protein